MQIHWLSIINSFVLVLLLTAFLAVILMRVLKNDFSRYMEMDEDDIVEEEGGWKLIHGDVFRFPQVRASVRASAASEGRGRFFSSSTSPISLPSIPRPNKPTHST